MIQVSKPLLFLCLIASVFAWEDTNDQNAAFVRSSFRGDASNATNGPTTTPYPTISPSPTAAPTNHTTTAPTPSNSSAVPTSSPVAPTPAPTNATVSPTTPAPTSAAPTTPAPTLAPTVKPTPAPTAKPTIAPTSKPTPSPKTPAPTSSPDDKKKKEDHPSLLRILGKTIAWLFIIALALLLFGFLMSNRYRIYYYMRSAWFRFLRWDGTQWFLRKTGLGRVLGLQSANEDLNSVIFDNDLDQGLLLQDT